MTPNLGQIFILKKVIYRNPKTDMDKVIEIQKLIWIKLLETFFFYTNFGLHEITFLNNFGDLENQNLKPTSSKYII